MRAWLVSCHQDDKPCPQLQPSLHETSQTPLLFRTTPKWRRSLPILVHKSAFGHQALELVALFFNNGHSSTLLNWLPDRKTLELAPASPSRQDGRLRQNRALHLTSGPTPCYNFTGLGCDLSNLSFDMYLQMEKR